MIRLDKFLCDMKAGSRSEVKALIRKGVVSVNGSVEKSPERKVDENADRVCLNGRPVEYQKYVYLLFHKPAGVVSATRDGREKTVLDWLRERNGENPLFLRELFPVGRLDKDTEGLLLLTDDGGLAHRLTSPAGHVPKTYYVEVDDTLTLEQLKALEAGVDIGEERFTRPARITAANGREPFHSPEAVSAWNLVITEGRFHQVKRMMQAVGRRVVYLKRIGMGPLNLALLPKAGQVRELTREETEQLRVTE